MTLAAALFDWSKFEQVALFVFAMDKGMLDAVAAVGVDAKLAVALTQGGYTTVGAFTTCFRSEATLDKWARMQLVTKKVLGVAVDVEEWEFHPSVGSLRALWLQLTEKPIEAGSDTAQPSTALAVLPMEGQLQAFSAMQKRTVGMTERLELETAYLAKYPGEVLCDATRPGPTMLWIGKRMKDPEVGYVWIAWVHHKSVEEESADPCKVAREAKALASMGLGCMYLPLGGEAKGDEADCKFEGGALKMRMSLELRMVAFAMLGLAHLSSLRYYVLRFMSLYMKKYGGVRMRGPNLQEAIEADRLAMTAAFQMVNAKQCTLDEALKDVADAKGELAIFLGPKPMESGSGQQGQKRAAADAAGGRQAKHVKPYAQWDEKASDGKSRCRNWLAGSCARGSSCKFVHY